MFTLFNILVNFILFIVDKIKRGFLAMPENIILLKTVSTKLNLIFLLSRLQL